MIDCELTGGAAENLGGASDPLVALDRQSMIRQEAARYLSYGWTPYRLKSGDKKPPGRKEQNIIRLETVDSLLNGSPYNIGVLLGKESNGLVDLDFDWPEARVVGTPMFHTLPCFGRPGAQSSHRLVKCPGAKSYKFSLPSNVADHRLPGQHALTVLEIRSSGHTMFPPSIHPNGEQVQWEKQFEPPTIAWPELRRHAGLTAFLAVCIRLWPKEGLRDDAAMALAGTLLSAGLKVESADRATIFVAKEACDEEYERRGKAKQTAERRATGEPATGLPRLVELLGLPPECIRVFASWLHIQAEQDETSPETAQEKVVVDPRAPLEIAREFIDRVFMNGDDRTLVYHRDEYFVFEAGRYRPMETNAIHKRLYEFLDNAVYVSGKKLERFRPNHKQVATVEHALRSLVLVEKDVLQPPCWIAGGGPRPEELFVCRNGLFDLTTGELRPHTPRLFTLNALEIDYDPSAPRPERWLRFLEEVFPDDPESVTTLQEIIGYSLTPETRLQKVFMLVAPPRSGKGTIARVMEQLVGKPNFAGISLDSLGQNFGLSPLIGKLVAVVADARLGSKADRGALVERILSISGEDRIQIDRKHMTHWEGRLPTRFFIHTNQVPSLQDESGAFVSRFVILTTESSFLGKEDPDLGNKLVAELPGILLWAIEGWRRLRERGRFVQPKSAQEILDVFANVSSPIRSFVEECCLVSPELKCEKDKLHEVWRQWNADQGRGSYLSKDQFALKLYAAFPQIKGGKGARSEGRPPEFRGICPIADLPVAEEFPF